MEKHDECSTINTKIENTKLIDSQEESHEAKSQHITSMERKFCETQNKLQKTKKKLQDTENKLQQKTKELKISNEKLKQNVGGGFSLPGDSDSYKNAIRYHTGEVISPERENLCSKSADTTGVSVIKLMGELFHQPKQKTMNNDEYVEKVKLVFRSIQIGDVHHINEKECFLKLQLQANGKMVKEFAVRVCDETPVHLGRCRKLVFQNDSVLLEANKLVYFLSVWVNKNYDLSNVDCFLINTKNSNHRELIIGDVDDSIDWDIHAQDNREFMLYFKT